MDPLAENYPGERTGSSEHKEDEERGEGREMIHSPWEMVKSEVLEVQRCACWGTETFL